MTKELKQLACDLVDRAKARGAAHADALAVASTGESVRVRNGSVESVEREDAQGLGLRVFVETPKGLAFATASTSDVSPEGLSRLVAQVIDMAKISEPDPEAVPPVGARHPEASELALWQEEHGKVETPWNTEAARAAALACEQAALAYSPQISNSEGGEAGFSSSRIAYAASDGFAAGYARSSAALSVSVIAGTGDGMQRDYAWQRALNAADLRSPEKIGQEAAERTVRRLGAGDFGGGAMPVIFEPRIATSLLGHLVSAINGKAVLQHRSFLAEHLGEKIFPDIVTVVDDPDHPEGLGNRLFDGEGTRCERLELVSAGRLNTWLTNRYTAKRLGFAETGHASRGLTGDIGISTSNLILQPGALSPDEMLAEIGSGLLVTELIGFGVNGVTGDYSRGAAGFLIENGKVGRPVHNITIAGNLKKMFAGISHVGSDLNWFGTTACPSIALTGMTVAGQAK